MAFRKKSSPLESFFFTQSRYIKKRCIFIEILHNTRCVSSIASLLHCTHFQVSHYGEVSNLDGFKSFPDYPESAKVMGGKSGVSLLDKVTT